VCVMLPQCMHAFTTTIVSHPTVCCPTVCCRMCQLTSQQQPAAALLLHVSCSSSIPYVLPVVHGVAQHARIFTI
jgi:hypothetical protein